jgi:transposase
MLPDQLETLRVVDQGGEVHQGRGGHGHHRVVRESSLNHESAGKQKRRGPRKGNPYLKTTLMTAAVCASRTRGSYLRDKFHRLRARMGAKQAAMAIAHKILVAVFHMLQRAVVFADLGADY